MPLPTPPHASAIIVAAGRGTRMGPNVDKLFLEVAGLPVVAHTWLNFDQCDAIHDIVLVVRPGMEEAFTDLAAALKVRKPWRLAHGGAERQDSVWNGLAALPTTTQLVAIQDGARPCSHPDLIHRCLAAAAQSGASVAAQRVTDTIKESSDGTSITRHPDRSRLWAVQTPQCFQVSVIRRALQEVRSRGATVTDDTAACDFIQQPVVLVENPEPNPKVTAPPDLPYIELLLRRHPATGAPAAP